VKGILAIEGIPGHHEAFRSREALTGDLGVKPHSPTRCPRPKAKDDGDKQPPRRRGRREGERQGATGVSEARAQSASWEENAHAREGRPQGSPHEVTCPLCSAEAFSSAVKRSVPRSCRTEPKTPWGVPAAKAASASREQTRCGYT
jgi:hypothetical protein